MPNMNHIQGGESVLEKLRYFRWKIVKNVTFRKNERVFTD